MMSVEFASVVEIITLSLVLRGGFFFFFFYVALAKKGKSGNPSESEKSGNLSLDTGTLQDTESLAHPRGGIWKKVMNGDWERGVLVPITKSSHIAQLVMNHSYSSCNI